jgi:hypothetical protein
LTEEQEDTPRTPTDFNDVDTLFSLESQDTSARNVGLAIESVGLPGIYQPEERNNSNRIYKTVYNFLFFVTH